MSVAAETDRQVISRHSKSFALAARLLPGPERRRAEALYAWCRAADDAVDHAASPAAARSALDALHAGVDDAYAGRATGGPAAALQLVVRECGVPREYPLAMLAGFAMDAAGTHPGAGVPGVVNSAKATVGVIRQDFGR